MMMRGLHQHRPATVASIVLLCLLQASRALPNPDFGINANINSGRNDVVDESQRLTSAFSAIDDYTVTLVGGYYLLGDVKSATESIGGQFMAAGAAMAQQLQSLATLNGPNNVESGFDAAYSAIDNLHDVMTSDLATDLSDLDELTGPFIPRKFRDAFDAMGTALNALTNKLHTLQDGVAAALAAYGGPGYVPSGIIRSRVPSRVQNDVVNAIVEVRTRISAVRFMVQNTLRDLDTADEFLEDVTYEVQYQVEEMSDETMYFISGVGELRDDVISYIAGSFSNAPTYGDPELENLVGYLSSITTYEAALEGPLEALIAPFGSSALSEQIGTFSSHFNSYFSAADEAVSDLALFFQIISCAAVRDTMLVLVAAGPHNMYCFSKYSTRLYNVYEMFFNSATRCYDNEYYRLVTLTEALEDLTDLIMFDVEDVFERLAVCIVLHANQDACVTTLGGYYGTLVEQLLDKFELGMDLTEHELDASIHRLEACVTSAAYSFWHSVRLIMYNMERCKTSGPRPDGADVSNESNETSET